MIFYQSLWAPVISFILFFADIASAAKGDIVIRLRATAVIADEQGFDSWADLKSFCTKQVTESFVDGYEGGFLNQWFIAYSEARDYQKTKGGFLLPYKKQFFVCEAEYIDWLGLDSDDPDWKAIDYDWVKPSSQKAYARLSKKWKSILGGRDE